MQLPKVEECVNVEPSHAKSKEQGEKEKRWNIRLFTSGAWLTLFLLYVVAVSFWQGDTVTTRYAAAGLGVVILLMACAFTPKLKIAPKVNYVGGWIPFSLMAALTWLYWGGSYNHRFDYLALLFCFVGAALLPFPEPRAWLTARRFGDPHPLRGKLGLQFALTFLLSFWGVASILDIAITSNPPLRRDPERFRTLRGDWRYRDLKVGVALSGGGYRAALMHAGVLDAFERLHVPVTHLTSVSGGSIIGAFYAAGGTPEDFRRGVAEGRFNLTREMTSLFNIVRIITPAQLPWTKTRLLPLGDVARTDVQAELLDKVLLNKITFAGLEHEGAPRLMVCATDLYSGASIGMSKQGVLRRFMIKPGEKDAYVNVADPEDNCTFVEGDGGYPLNARLSQVVAASGAFPGAFNAVREEIRLGGPERQPVLLADGGLSDNSALTVMAFANARAGWNLDIAVSSDASALFNKRDDIMALGEVSRAVDIVYANVGVRREQGHSCPVNKTQLLLTPGKYTDLSGEKKSDRLRPAVEEAVARLNGPALDFACDLLEQSGSRDELQTLKGAALAGDPAARHRLAELFHAELDAALSAFTTAPTLEDNFGGETAGRLYRLGQLLVILEWGQISEELEKKLREKAGEVARHAAPAAGARARRTQ
jgi:predicted acylesterase/phospholipase RssA